MSAKYVWETDDREPLVSIDPYSQWTFVYGKDFDFSQREAKEHDDDFEYAVIVDSFLESVEPKPPDLAPDLLPGEIFRFSNADKANVISVFQLLSIKELLQGAEKGKSEARDAVPDPKLVFRAPLRKRSVNPEFAGGERDWTPYDNADSKKMVIVAAIDDGINFAHERFRVDDGNGGYKSRVDFAWVQDGTFDPGNTMLPFGREFTRTEIEEQIEQAGLDELGLLQNLELINFGRFGQYPVARRASHGTHVLDIAAGADSNGDPEELMNRRLITVQLPPLVTLETSGSLLGLFLMAGTQYILSRARAISRKVGKPIPVVINFSFGLSGGPHNGLHFIERAIKSLINQHQDELKKCFGDNEAIVEVVVPAGNRYLTRGHAESPVADNGEASTLTLPWRVQPGDRSSSYLEVWLPDSQDTPQLPPFTLQVKAPDEDEAQLVLDSYKSGPEPKILRAEAPGLNCTVIARASLDEPNIIPLSFLPQSAYWRILIVLAPTEVPPGAHRSERDAVPSGVWEVQVTAQLGSGAIEAWIQRDDSPIGYRSHGRQSYFDHEGYERFDCRGDWQIKDNECPVKRKGSLSGIATKRDFIVLGGYQYRDGKVSLYSAAANAPMRKPTGASAADTSRALRGINGAGSRCGNGGIAISGTSVAAPQAVRWIAEKLIDPATPDRRGAAIIEDLLVKDEGGDENRIGEGRLPVHPELEFRIRR